MLQAVQRVAGVDKPVEQDAVRMRPEKSEVNALICDFGKARAAFGYEPSVAFDEGLSHLRDYLLARDAPVGVAEYRV
jgi:dTDP-glucose 4,6-dehydratase